MRADMHELLVERPRWGHAARYPRGHLRKRRGDDPPAREALSRGRYGDKSLSENFAPLVRFLRTNVGRPWAKVHAEMASVLAPTNAVQRHVLDHLGDFLVTSVFERGGRLWGARRRRPPEPLEPRTGRDVFYVHPRTGLLCVVPRRTRGRSNANVRELSSTKQLRRLHGLWYELTVAPFPPGVNRATCIDAITKRPVRWASHALYPELRDLWESGRYTIARRQVSKRELRQLL